MTILSPTRAAHVAAWTCCLWLAMDSGLRLAAQEPSSGLQAVQAIEQAMVAAIARAEKSVVAIARYRIDGARGERHPRLPAPGRGDPTARAVGVPNEFASGVVIDRHGYILTNYHVLGEPAQNQYHVWVNRRPFTAVVSAKVEQVKAGDPWTDLAVLKVAADDLEPITFGNAKDLKKGQIVIALGNPYGIASDGQVSASWGIISNLSCRPPAKPLTGEGEPAKESLYDYGGLIQTDARLHLGTSGGALINWKGEMIGLTTALAAADGYERSLGFAIPVDEAFRRTVETLKAGRKADIGFLGVAPQNLADALRQQGRHGALISHLVPGTPAFVASLREGDIITRLNDAPIYDRDTLMLELGRQPVGAKVRLTVERGATPERRGRPLTTTAQLSKKYVSSARSAFAQVPDPSWRGIRVDYATALPQTLWRQAFQESVPSGCLAVIDVDRDSPAWKAGLRPAMLITQVDNRRVATPDEFFAAVRDKAGDVRLKLVLGAPDAVTIPPSK